MYCNFTAGGETCIFPDKKSEGVSPHNFLFLLYPDNERLFPNMNIHMLSVDYVNVY